MNLKKCIICSIEKEISFFYKHPAMGDGFLNKCKECCKSQSKKRQFELSKNPEWIESERLRGKEKYKRLNYKEKQKLIEKNFPWKQNQRYKNTRRWYKSKYGFLDKNIELHHWSYLDENLRDVILLDRSTHKRLHALLTVDIDKKCYYVSETKEFLDTKEKHLNFINLNF
jgi:hypothetical protein